ncbi:MAG: hypothetical protein ACI8RZ_002718 [Myxococcota bacterium]|jgi:hypothetical protein
MLALLLMPLASALDGNDSLDLTLTGDVEVSGWFLRAEADRVVISSEVGIVEVPLVLIESVSRNGEPMGAAAFAEELAEAWGLLEAFRADPPPHPAPAVTFGLSLLWAGSGHAAIGDWRGFTTYSIIEGVLLSSIALNVATSNPQPIPSLIALDVIFKVWSARESTLVARRRQDVLRQYDTVADAP